MRREDAIEALAGRARKEVDDGLLPSCQWALAYDGEVIAGDTVGDVPDGADSRYVIYSCTKAVTSSAFCQLIGERSVALSDRVADHVPEFGSNGKDEVTIEQVLLHTSGFPSAPLRPSEWAIRKQRLEAFAGWRLNWAPGSRFEYHTTSAHWVLAEILERTDEVDFRSAVHRRVLAPCGLERTSLGVPVADQGDIARAVIVGAAPPRTKREESIGASSLGTGEVTDETMLLLADAEGIAVGVPGGGGVSTAAEVALFYQALLHDHQQLWNPDVLMDATRHVRNTFIDPQTGASANRALAVVVAGGDGSAHVRGFGHATSPRAFGHPGAGGQIAWADPDSGVSFVWLTNGLDRDLLRQGRRTSSISSKAGQVAFSRGRRTGSNRY